MGNTIADESVVEYDNKVEVKKLDPCVMAGLGAAHACQEAGGTPAQCLAAANAARKACETA